MTRQMYSRIACLYIYLMGIVIPVTNGVYQDRYIGCFYGNSPTSFTRVLSSGDSSNIEKCIQLCQAYTKLTYATLKNGTLCTCGDDYGIQVSDDNCNLNCSPEGRETCRGVVRYENAYALFSVCPIGTYGCSCENVCHCKREVQCPRMTGTCPNGCYENWTGNQCYSASLDQQFIGCFADKITRSMKDCAQYESNNLMTIQTCIQMCSERNKTYAGVQFSYQCFCGDIYNKFRRHGIERCNMTCTGNTNEKCGGVWAKSVYSVCPAGNYGTSCLERCHCHNGGRCDYITGSCIPLGTQCKPGWKGSSCNIRDCCKNNGDCHSSETCYSIAMNSAIITACRCSEGYQRKYTSDSCTDIDECSLSPPLCDPVSTICSNTIGSFQCSCKDGYTQNNTTLCIDIDECQRSLARCDTDSTICNNIPGGYECSCKPGYTRKDKYTCTDLDECSLSPPPCDPVSTICNNTIGSFQCTCKDGYTENNTTLCIDIDECQLSLARCDTDSTICNNIPGGYECSCKPVYTRKDQYTCTGLMTTSSSTMDEPTPAR